MLRKLLKYDLISTSKLSLFLIVAALATSFLGGVCTWLQTVIPTDQSFKLARSVVSIFLSLSTLGVIVALAMIPIMVFVRFYKNLYTDEGYLTFTLPASRFKIHLSKTITAFIWIAAVAVTATLSIDLFYIFTPQYGEDITSVTVGILDSFNAYDSIIWVIVYFLFILLLLSCIAILFINTIHLSITVGAVVVKRARVLCGVGCYHVISSALNFAAGMLILAAAYFSDPIIDEIFNSGSTAAHLLTLFLLFLVCLILFVLSAVVFTITQRIIDRKLNLI